MDSAVGRAKVSELTNLLTALQSFSISNLQNQRTNEQHKTFLFQVLNAVRELEAILETVNKGNDASEQLNQLRKNIWGLIEANSNLPDDMKMDNKLMAMLTNFYLQTITTLPPVREEIKKPAITETPAPSEPVAAPVATKPLVVTNGDEIAEKIKLLEKSRIYLPPTKTATVVTLETKFDEALNTLKNSDLSLEQKAKYINDSLVEFDKIIARLQSNTEIVLTSIQAGEISGIKNQLQQLSVLIQGRIKQNAAEDLKLQSEIDNLLNSDTHEDHFIALDKMNESGKHYLHNAEFAKAEKIQKKAVALAGKLSVNEDKAQTVALLTAVAHELLGRSYIKQNNFTEAKSNYQQAANILKKSGNNDEHIAMLLGSADLAEEKESIAILQNDKDIRDFKNALDVLQKSGDPMLVQMTHRIGHKLYNQFVDPKITPAKKIQLIQESADRWNKYLNERTTTTVKAEWYTPEMDKLIQGGLADILRIIREMFAAQAAAQQASSPAAMVEAKEKATTEAQLRAEAEAKARRDALLAKAEASRARVEAEKSLAEAQAKAKEFAAKRAAEEELKRKLQLEAEEKARVAAETAARIREQELLAIRKTISHLMNEAKEALDKSLKYIGRHEYKDYLLAEETKLSQTLEQFQQIKPDELIPADIATKAKCESRLGMAFKNHGKFNEAESFMKQSIDNYDKLLKLQDYGNLSSAVARIEGLAELARLYYFEKRYSDAETAFKAAANDCRYMLARSNMEESFQNLFGELQQQNKSNALLMAKCNLEHAVHTPEEKSENMIETLYHFPALKRKVHDDELKFVHQILALDKGLNARNDRVLKLREILLSIEKPLFTKVTRLSKITDQEMTNKVSSLDIMDKNILKSYRDALINFAFVEALKNAADTLPKELTPFVTDIKAIRAELRNGQDLKLTTLGLSLEQKITYLEYEILLLRSESRGAEKEHAQPLERLQGLLDLYRNELASPGYSLNQLKTKKKKWSLGNMVSVLKRKRKKPLSDNKLLGESRTK